MFCIKKVVYTSAESVGFAFDIIGDFKSEGLCDPKKLYEVEFDKVYGSWNVLEIIPYF